MLPDDAMRERENAHVRRVLADKARALELNAELGLDRETLELFRDGELPTHLEDLGLDVRSSVEARIVVELLDAMGTGGKPLAVRADWQSCQSVSELADVVREAVERDLRAELEPTIRDSVVERLEKSLREARERAQAAEERLERQERELGRLRALRRLWELGRATLRGFPKLTKAQERMEVWRLRAENKALNEQLAGVTVPEVRRQRARLRAA